ncbi:MAG: hypothetical protein ACP5PB_01595 [Acidimicrobiales bacterium]
MFLNRFLRRGLLVVTLGVTASVSGAPLAAQAATTSPSVASVLKAVRAAMATERGVHIVVRSRSATTHNSVVADLGRTSGSETFTSGAAKVSISVTPTYAYLRGNASGLVTLVGLTSSEQKKVGTKSISMKAGTSPYVSFRSNLTVGAFSAFLPTQKDVRLSRGVHGAYVLSWTTKATSTTTRTTSVLTMSAGKRPLPQREVVSSSSGSGTTYFSRWGESVKESAPPAGTLIPYTAVVKG